MSSKSVSDFIQNPGNSLSDTVTIVELFELNLQETRTDEKCQEFWTEADCVCKFLEIPDRVTRRKRRLCSALVGTIVNAPVEGGDPNLFETFKRNIVAVIDKMLSEIAMRLSNCNKKIMKRIDALTPSSENCLNEHAISEFAEEYSSLLGLSVDYLNTEIFNLKLTIKRKKESHSGDCPESLLALQSYVHRLRDTFAELGKLIIKACTLPVSTASCLL